MLSHQQSAFGVVAAILVVGLAMNAVRAEPLTIDASAVPPQPKTAGFKMGASHRADGHEITVSSYSLIRDGKPWLPVMGEYHFSRYPAAEWRDELLKMKAGGINIVSTYVFWIHHEEVKDKWDWTGQRSLRDFVKTCADVGLPVIVRAGPWCHGEVRNGGQPDYIVKELGRRARTNDPEYLARVRILYGQIADQLKGLLWKDGGPVVGMQFENEYSGSPDHLMMLKKIAQEDGMDLPIYTKTGWPVTRTQVPFGEMLPLEGAYAEGFWDKQITPMPGKYPTEFLFAPVRTNATVGTDQLGEREARDDQSAREYPYLTCELGGGMMSSYHRRVLIYPDDIAAIALLRVGSGSNLPGYYMYHGGTNPDGQLSTLQESQESNYPNDMPVKTYDFQAPLGEFGQVRPHYHELRRMHIFLHNFGPELTAMHSVAPDKKPASAKDTDMLRWVVRSNGDSGYVFVNNYQRLQPMPAKQGVQFDLKLTNGGLRFPAEPFTVPADSYFVWPFNLDLGSGVKLVYATAQPICQVKENGGVSFIFAQTRDVPGDFVLDTPNAKLEPMNGQPAAVQDGSRIRVSGVKTGTDTAIRLRTADGRRINILLLDESTSLQLWDGTVAGKEGTVLLSPGNIIFDGDKLRVASTNPADLKASVFGDGSFRLTYLPMETLKSHELSASLESLKQAGPAREIKNGSRGQPGMPTEADWDQAAVWRIKLPAGLDLARDPILRLHYTGDVARIYLDGKLLTDNFYFSKPFDIGLKRFGPDVSSKELLLKILPLRKDAPIYLAKEAQPDFGSAASIVNVSKIEIIENLQAQLSLK